MNLNEEKKCQNLKKHILNELYVKEEEIQKLENKISNLTNEYYNSKEKEKSSK
jgi:flagellar motility protein MotE (MotC chaperone)